MRNVTIIKMAVILLCFFLVLFFASIINDSIAKDKSNTVANESKAAAILRDLAAGKPVPNNEFNSVFSEHDPRRKSTHVRHAAEDLGIKIEDVQRMTRFDHISVVYTGPKEDIPTKLQK